jgi:hypothetical protein
MARIGPTYMSAIWPLLEAKRTSACHEYMPYPNSQKKFWRVVPTGQKLNKSFVHRKSKIRFKKIARKILGGNPRLRLREIPYGTQLAQGCIGGRPAQRRLQTERQGRTLQFFLAAHHPLGGNGAPSSSRSLSAHCACPVSGGLLSEEGALFRQCSFENGGFPWQTRASNSSRQAAKFRQFSQNDEGTQSTGPAST